MLTEPARERVPQEDTGPGSRPGHIRVELVRRLPKKTWLEHLVPFTKAISWPVAVLVIALVFHNDISNQLNRVETVKWGKVELALQKVREAVSTGNTFETPQQAPAILKSATQALVNLQQALLTGNQAASVPEGWSFVGEYSKGTWDRQTLQFNSYAPPDSLRGQILTVIDEVYVRRTAPTGSDYNLGMIVGILPVGARVAIGQIREVSYQGKPRVWAEIRPVPAS